MSIKLRRNLPLVLLLMAFLAFLILVLGNQPIVAYTADRDAIQAEPTATMDNRVTNAVGGATGYVGTAGADSASP